MTSIAELDEKHPYFVACILSMMIISFSLFYTSFLDISENYTPTEKLDIIDIDTIRAPKRIVKKTISTEKGEITEKSPIQRAKGTSDLENAVDIAFFPNIAPPKPIGRLKKIYPANARQKDIEATLFVEILIDHTGKVRRVNIIGARLSKDLPPDSYAAITKAFGKAAIKILMASRWTPSIINGKKVPIRMELPLEFRLEN